MDINKSLLSNKDMFLKSFKLKYDYLPNSFNELDSDILNTIKLIDEAYVNNAITYEEAFGLISKLLDGLKTNKSNNDFISSDQFYDLLLNDNIDSDKLNQLFSDNQINYHMYSDGLNYLSKEKEDNSFTR